MNIKPGALKLIRISHLEIIIEQTIHWIRQFMTLKMVERRVQIETTEIICLLLLSSNGIGIRVRKIPTGEEAIKEVELRVVLTTNRPMKMTLATCLWILMKKALRSRIIAGRPRNKVTRTLSFQTQEMKTESRVSTGTAPLISLQMWTAGTAG